MSNTIRYTSDGAVARITLARPPLNILTIPMMQEVNAALQAAAAEPALRALVLAAEGKAFCAGVAVEDHVGDRVKPMIEAFHRIFHLLHGLDCATIAVVHGPALGGGAELAAFCDFVIAGERATIGQPEIRLGVFPPVAAWCYPRRIGEARTVQLLLTGETLTAQEAQRVGLVDRVVPDSELEAAARAAIDLYASKSAVALRLARRAVREAASRPFEQAIGEAERLYDRLMQTEDATEGLRAFLEKRQPVWRHR